METDNTAVIKNERLAIAAAPPLDTPKVKDEIRIKIYNSITEIDEREWDSIVARNRLICTHRYLEAIEKSQINDCRYYYPVAYEGNRITAHTSVYLISTELDTFAQGPVKEIINLIRRKWKKFLVFRSLECGTPVALGNTISFADGTDRVNALKQMCREIERLARELHAGTVVFRDFYDEELGFFDYLTERGYTRIHNLPSTKIEIKWKSFNEYLNSMRSQYRWKVNNRIKKFLRDNVTIEILEDFSDYSDELERLWTNVYNHATEYKRERLTASFFKNVDKYLDNRSAIILARKDDVPIGFTLLFFDDKTLIPIFSGLDYTYNLEYCVYFNLLYKALEIGIEKGMKNVDLGITTLVPKKEMGATIVQLNAYMKQFNPLLNKIIPQAFEVMTPKNDTKPVRVFSNR